MSDLEKKQTDTRESEETKHYLAVHSRKAAEVHGVTDVIRFDETAALLDTQVGKMLIEGTDLRVVTLDTKGGVFQVVGTIDSVQYERAEHVQNGKKKLHTSIIR